MNEPLELKSLEELFPTFSEDFYNLLKKALNCGALSGDELPYSVYRSVLLDLAKNHYFNERYDKETYNNLRHFI